MRGGSPSGVRALRWRGRRAPASGGEADAAPRAGTPVLLRHPLFVSGTTGDGAFRGRAVAVAVDAGADLGADRTRYLVERTGRGEPFWVHESDIERSYPLLPGDAVIGYVTIGPLERRSATRAAVAALRATCRRADWRLAGVICDNERDPVADRPGLARALERIAAREAAGLVVADLARAAGSDDALVALLRPSAARAGDSVRSNPTSSPRRSRVSVAPPWPSGPPRRSGSPNCASRASLPP